MRARNGAGTTNRGGITTITFGQGYITPAVNSVSAGAISMIVTKRTPAKETANKALAPASHEMRGANIKTRYTFTTTAIFRSNIHFTESRRWSNLNVGTNIGTNRLRLLGPFIDELHSNVR